MYDDTVKVLKNILHIGSKTSDVILGPLTKYNIHSVPLREMVHHSIERYGLVKASKCTYKPFTMKPKITVPVVYFGFHHGKYDKELQECIIEFFGNGGKFDLDDFGTNEHVLK